MKAVTLSRHGGSEVLQYNDVPVPEIGDDQVLVRVAAAGVNFIDIYQRTGLYPVALPYCPGLEAAGTVEKTGTQASNFKPGERVAFCGTTGSYAEYVAAPASRLVRLPDRIDLEVAAAVMLQGMTAYYLARETYPLKAGDKCLVHAAAGGVGQLLIQLAKRAGAFVIGTTSTPAKTKLVKELGADAVINYVTHDFETEVTRLTGGAGLHVIYDSVGKTTFGKGLNCLKRRGMMVLYGQSSGPVPKFDPAILSAKGSLFLTRPSLFHYIEDAADLQRYAKQLFSWLEDGSLKVRTGKTFALQQAAEAHDYLTSRKSTGKILLIPNH